MADYGLKISRDGYGIETTDPRNLVFSSGFNTAAIALQGSSNQTGDSGTLTFTITHNLGFIPYPLVYMNTSKYSSYWKWCPYFTASWASDFIGNKDSIYNTNIRVNITDLIVIATLGNGVSDTITIKYYLLNISI